MNLPELLPGLEAAPNVHPMFVHLPLGLWPIALGFFILAAARRSERLLEVGRWLLYIATLAAVVTAATGWLAAEGLGHDSPGHDLIHTHRDWMLAATAISVLASAFAFILRRSVKPAHRWLQVVATALTLGVAVIGADRGAYLVFGRGVGVQLQTDTPPTEGGAHTDHEHTHDH